MAVKVTLKNGDVEQFDSEEHAYVERPSDGFLEVHQDGEIAKVFAKGYWVAVEGKRYVDPLFDL